MSIASELQDKINAKAAIKAAIEAKGVTVGDVKLNQYAAKIDEIQQGGTGDWIRPSDWLPIDSLVVAGEQKTVGLYAIYPNVNDKGMTNTVAFTVTGNYTVDWGDGVVENFNSNVQAQHIYDYDSLSASTDCVRGYRQAIITITPQNGKNITQILFGRKHSSVVFGRISSQWLDIVISGTAISYFKIQDSFVSHNMLEKIKAIQSTGSLISLSNSFSDLYNIKIIDLNSLNTTNVTTFAGAFQSTTIQKLDLSNLIIKDGCSFDYIFNQCSYLVDLKLPYISTRITGARFFRSCQYLQKVDFSKLDLSLVTDGREIFSFCYALQEIDLSHTTLQNITTVSAGAFLYSNSLIKVRLPNIRISFTVASNPLSATALNELFSDLFDLTDKPSQTITITGCTGAATCDKTIATNKNWTVIG